MRVKNWIFAHTREAGMCSSLLSVYVNWTVSPNALIHAQCELEGEHEEHCAYVEGKRIRWT